MKKIILSLFGALLLFSSCDLTEVFYEEGDEVSMKKVYIRFPDTSTERLGTVSTDTFNIIAGIGGSALIEEDVTVNVVRDAEFLAAYNEKTSSSYEMLPEEFLAVAPDQGVIKAGDQGTMLTYVLADRTEEENAAINNYVLLLRVSSVTSGYYINDDTDDDPDLNLSYLIVQFNF